MLERNSLYVADSRKCDPYFSQEGEREGERLSHKTTTEMSRPPLYLPSTIFTYVMESYVSISAIPRVWDSN